MTDAVNKISSEIWEKAYMDLQRPLAEGAQYLRRRPWGRLKSFIRTALAASSGSSTFLYHTGITFVELYGLQNVGVA